MSIKITNMKEEDGMLYFTISGININIANGIRRTILSDIKSLILYNIYIENNNSCLNDEVMKQRLSCIPVHLSPSDENYKYYQIELDIVNNYQENIHVTSNDIKIIDTRNGNIIDNIVLFPPDEFGNFIEIVILKPSTPLLQSQLKLRCSLNVTQEDDKNTNCVASTSVFMKFIDEDTICKIYKEKYNQENIENIDKYLLRRKLKHSDYSDFLSETDYEFIIETIGFFTNKDIFKKALRIIINKLENLGLNIIFKNHDNNQDIFINNEKYTIGNMLKEILVNENVIFQSLEVNNNSFY